MNIVSANGAPEIARPRIEVNRLIKTFHRVGGQKLTPVDDISLDVGAREMVILLGPSGCGKTTLLRCIAGLERPDSGEIVLDGKIVFSSKKKIFVPPTQRQLSMIFQSFALWPHMSVFENIAYPLESRKAPKNEITPRVRQVMQMVGISDLELQYPGRISGGQQQRVALARALVSNSVAVLFDEPLSNVDARVREHLRIEMKRMQKQLQFSGLYVTHDQAEAMELGDRIAVLDSGRIAALGRPRDIYEQPGSEYVATFLGSANIWPGSVVDAGPTHVRLATAGGDLIAEITPGASPSAPGADLKIMVRPEKIRISKDPRDDGRNALSGRITARTFTGPAVQFFVECAGLTVRVVSMQDNLQDDLAEGDMAHLSIDPGAVKILPANGTPADRTPRA